jgi:hypothetical protein
MSDTQPNKSYYPPMGAREYKLAIARSELPEAAFAKLIGVSWRQGERYRNGHSTIPDPVAKLIRTILKHKLKVKDVG